MKTIQFSFRFLMLFTLVFLLCACGDKQKSCVDYTELTSTEHVVDISVLNQIPNFYDTLAKYPQLQVYRVIDDQYLLGMHCNVFYQNLLIFSDQYSFFHSKTDTSNFTLENDLLDSVSFELTPSLNYMQAIGIAQEHIDFQDECISYRLGILNTNTNKDELPKNYKLAWRVQSENGAKYVTLDANSGVVYQQFDGIYH